MPFCHKSETTISKHIVSVICLLFSTLSSRMSKNMCKLRHKLRNAKKGVGQTITWSNEAWFRGRDLTFLDDPHHPLCVIRQLSCVTYHVTCDTWRMTCDTRHMKKNKKKTDKLVELVGRGSVINGAYPV